jgi:hypothetical protein
VKLFFSVAIVDIIILTLTWFGFVEGVNWAANFITFWVIAMGIVALLGAMLMARENKKSSFAGNRLFLVWHVLTEVAFIGILAATGHFVLASWRFFVVLATSHIFIKD